MQNILLTPYELGGMKLKNRLVMAPLTRRRATADHIPTSMMATYYAQRSGAGLIIAEATQISPDAVGYPNTPGIHNKKQMNAWKAVTRAVHEKDGRIFIQLWHVGRHSHKDLLPRKQRPLAPSAVPYHALIDTGNEQKLLTPARAMNKKDILRLISAFRNAARNARSAGFDGIEIHGANGYLIDQFLQDTTNLRQDEYGGRIENRSRFLFQILEAVMDGWPENRVGLRLSPSGTYHGMRDSKPVELFSYIIDKLNDYPLAYLHLIEPVFEPVDHLTGYLKQVTVFFRKLSKHHLISSGGYTPETAANAVDSGHADLIAFGKLYISNPDLDKRICKNLPLIPWDTNSFYKGGAKGYIDYM